MTTTQNTSNYESSRALSRAFAFPAVPSWCCKDCLPPAPDMCSPAVGRAVSRCWCHWRAALCRPLKTPTTQVCSTRLDQARVKFAEHRRVNFGKRQGSPLRNPRPTSPHQPPRTPSSATRCLRRTSALASFCPKIATLKRSQITGRPRYRDLGPRFCCTQLPNDPELTNLTAHPQRQPARTRHRSALLDPTAPDDKIGDFLKGSDGNPHRTPKTWACDLDGLDTFLAPY